MFRMDNLTGQLKRKSYIENASENERSLPKPKLHISHEQLKHDTFLERELNHPGIDVKLTKREREILDFVLAGHTNRQIAQKLFRTERTIEYHRNRMMRKLGAHNPIELVKRAIAMGIV